MKKILIVEDEESIRGFLKINLKRNGFEVLETDNGEEGLEIVEREEPDIVILDVMLPGIDGFEVCKRVREKQESIGIIMLTAKGQEMDKIIGLEYGADDYMVKPFDPKELLARVKAVTRRYVVDNQSKDVIKYSDLIIDIGAYEVTYKENIVKLAPKELELLHFMASNPNKVFTREQLMYEVWGYDYPGDSRTVDVHIKRLREKVKGGEKWELQTVWGVGYKFEVR